MWNVINCEPRKEEWVQCKQENADSLMQPAFLYQLMLGFFWGGGWSRAFKEEPQQIQYILSCGVAVAQRR